MRRRRRSSISSVLIMGGITLAALVLYASTFRHGTAAAVMSIVGVGLLLACVYAPAWTERGGPSSTKLYVVCVSSYLVSFALFAAAIKAPGLWTWPVGLLGCGVFVVAHVSGAQWRQSQRRSRLLRPHHDVTEAFKRPPGSGRKVA